MTDPIIKYNPRKLLLVADLAGTLLFAIEGAIVAVAGDLDFLGLMVLAFATALAGGIFRDLLIGAVPPASLRDWRYPATAFVGGAAVFFLHHFLKRIPAAIMIDLDAMALALFAVAGTEKALEYRLNRSRHFPGANSARSECGYIRYGSSGRRGGFGLEQKIEIPTRLGSLIRGRCLLLSSRG
jgi:hypothetical protein